MKKISLIIIGIFILSLSQLIAQNQSDAIQVVKKNGTRFIQNDQALTPKQLIEITKTNVEAYKYMKKAKSNFDAGMVFASAGGFLIGWPIGTAIGGGEADWAMAGIGAGLALLSIPLASGYNKKAKKAVEIYNKGLNQTKARKVSYHFGVTKNGIGLRVQF